MGKFQNEPMTTKLTKKKKKKKKKKKLNKCGAVEIELGEIPVAGASLSDGEYD
jgi:hypothetical protein